MIQFRLRRDNRNVTADIPVPRILGMWYSCEEQASKECYKTKRGLVSLEIRGKRREKKDSLIMFFRRFYLERNLCSQYRQLSFNSAMKEMIEPTSTKG